MKRWLLRSEHIEERMARAVEANEPAEALRVMTEFPAIIEALARERDAALRLVALVSEESMTPQAILDEIRQAFADAEVPE